MDAAELELDGEEAAAEEAGYDSIFGEEEEEATLEEMLDRHSAASLQQVLSSAVPAFQHHFLLDGS